MPKWIFVPPPGDASAHSYPELGIVATAGTVYEGDAAPDHLWHPVDAGQPQSVERTLSSAVLNAAIARQALANPLTELDVWAALDGTSLTTYTDYLTYVRGLLDTGLDAGTITETDRGAGSTSDHIWTYRAGDGPLKALLVSGLHGEEVLSCFLGLRWFHAFATSDDPAMAYLRSRITVEWVACADPAGYRTNRLNANSVDLNRNFAFYHAQSEAADKGAAPLDQPETQIIKALLDEGNACVIDLHGRGPVTNNKVGYGIPSQRILTNRALARGALELWAKTYADLYAGTDELIGPEPNLRNYAASYQRFGTRRTASSLLIEVASDQHGSSAYSLSANAARLLGGLITTYFTMWADQGQVEPSPYPMLTSATGPKSSAGTSMSTGGNRIDSSTLYPIVWSTVSPSAGGVATDEIRFVVPFPCDVKCAVEGYLVYSAAAAGTTFRGSVGWSLDDAANYNSSSVNSVTVESTNADRRIMFQSTYRFADLAVDNETVHVARVFWRRNAGGTADIVLCRAFVELVPRYDAADHATVRQGV